MKNWIEFVAEHHNIIKLSDSSIKIENIAYNENINKHYDDVITKVESGYKVECMEHGTNNIIDVTHFDTIKNYLGY